MLVDRRCENIREEINRLKQVKKDLKLKVKNINNMLKQEKRKLSNIKNNEVDDELIDKYMQLFNIDKVSYNELHRYDDEKIILDVFYNDFMANIFISHDEIFFKSLVSSLCDDNSEEIDTYYNFDQVSYIYRLDGEELKIKKHEQKNVTIKYNDERDFEEFTNSYNDEDSYNMGSFDIDFMNKDTIDRIINNKYVKKLVK